MGVLAALGGVNRVSPPRPLFLVQEQWSPNRVAKLVGRALKADAPIAELAAATGTPLGAAGSRTGSRVAPVGGRLGDR